MYMRLISEHNDYTEDEDERLPFFGMKGDMKKFAEDLSAFVEEKKPATKAFRSKYYDKPSPDVYF